MHAIGLLILRLGIGALMLTHGWGKLQMVRAGEFDKFGDPIGLGPGPSLVLAMLAEFVCPILVMAGLATRLAAIGPVVAMSVAAFIVHRADPWLLGAGAAKEPALLYLVPFLALIFTGPGCISLDALFASWWRRRGG